MINLKRNERDAIEALDGQALRNAVEDVTTHRSMTALRRLELHRLGLYVTQTETRVLRALSELGKAKSAAKISRQKQDLSEAGWDLMSAVDEMRARAEQERRDAERFRIQDLIMDPSFRRPDMSVTVSYNWRLSGEDEWQCQVQAPSCPRIRFHCRLRPPQAFCEAARWTACLDHAHVAAAGPDGDPGKMNLEVASVVEVDAEGRPAAHVIWIKRDGLGRAPTLPPPHRHSRDRQDKRMRGSSAQSSG